MRRSSRNGLIAIRPTAASHTLLAKCQSCGIRTAKITWSRGSTGSSFTCEHTSRGIFPHDLFSLLESLGSLEMWRILRISLVTKLKSAKTKVLEIGNQSYFLGRRLVTKNIKNRKGLKKLLNSLLLKAVLLWLIGLLFENRAKREPNKKSLCVCPGFFNSYYPSIFRLKWLIKCYPKTWVISSMPWN